MPAQLGAPPAEVHAKAREVLDFWFLDTPEDKRWTADPVFDARIRNRFGPLRDLVLGSGAAGWREDSRTLLAAIVLLDQFSRNLYRGEAEAYAADPLALTLTRTAIEQGWERDYSADERQFLYMPLMHGENPATHAQSLEKFATLSDTKALEYAREHAEVIARFGRFPARNAALGRESTPEEAAWLSRPGVDW